MKHCKNRFFRMIMAGLVLGLSVVLTAGSASALEFDVQGTKVNIGGYLKLMANYDINGTVNSGNHPTDGDILNAYDAPLDGSTYEDENRFSMTARESRLNLRTSTATDFGTISTYFEGDANGDIGGTSSFSNSRTFRLRHALGTVTFGQNSIAAGQTWSTFMDFAGAVPVMDLSSDPGAPFARQPLVRFTHNFTKGHYLAVAVENPSRGLTSNGNGSLIANAETSSTETVPDFIVKYFYANGRFSISPKLLVRRFELDDQSAFAWGTNLTGHVKIGKGHKIYLGLTYGDGIGRYAGLGLNTGAGLTATGEIGTVKFKSINTGFTIALKDNVAWTVGCGYSENDEDAYTGSDAVLSGNANKSAFGWHTNIKWQITPKFSYAVGVNGYAQEVMDGREGEMIRIQNYLKYDF